MFSDLAGIIIQQQYSTIKLISQPYKTKTTAFFMLTYSYKTKLGAKIWMLVNDFAV